MHKTMSAFDIS